LHPESPTEVIGPVFRAECRPKAIVIITTRNGKTVDTERDLTAPERHVLQKLFLWKSMADSLEQFREKKELALLKGWNNSGPIAESPNLKTVITDLEDMVLRRLREENLHSG
jgi:hypothetical protein